MIRGHYRLAWREGDRSEVLELHGVSEIAVGGMARGLANTTGIAGVRAETVEERTRAVFP